jgi:hypothetical protein
VIKHLSAVPVLIRKGYLIRISGLRFPNDELPAKCFFYIEKDLPQAAVRNSPEKRFGIKDSPPPTRDRQCLPDDDKSEWWGL